MMEPPEQITTERLILRKIRLEDAPILFAAYTQDDEVTRYTTWRPHQKLEQTEEFVRSCLSAWERKTRFPFVIMLREGNEIIGMIDPHVEGSIVGLGYVIAHDHQGKGYATEAARAMIDWALQQPEINRVYATTDVENAASARVMEKAGMQREGLLLKYIIHPDMGDEPRDSYIYAVVK
jgi:RimJ/RimL family protein N-acetyltransferase